jgi:hypothetical protein
MADWIVRLFGTPTAERFRSSLAPKAFGAGGTGVSFAPFSQHFAPGYFQLSLQDESAPHTTGFYVDVAGRLPGSLPDRYQTLRPTEPGSASAIHRVLSRPFH